MKIVMVRKGRAVLFNIIFYMSSIMILGKTFDSTHALDFLFAIDPPGKEKCCHKKKTYRSEIPVNGVTC